MTISFTPELIAGIVGAAFSWVFAWFPGLRTWYAALKSEVKSAIMLGLLALSTGAIYLLALNGTIAVSEPITTWKLVSVFFYATTINQVTYSLTPQAKDVRDIKTTETIVEIKEVKEDAKG